MSVLPGTQYQASQGINATNNTTIHNSLANNLPASVNSVGGQSGVANNVSESQVLDKKRLHCLSRYCLLSIITVG